MSLFSRNTCFALLLFGIYCTTFHEAVKNSDIEKIIENKNKNSEQQQKIIEYFLTKGAKINEANNNGYTPLHFAARNGLLEISRILIDHGGNVNSIDKFGTTPLYGAKIEGHKDIISLLEKRGAKLTDRIS